MNTKDAPHKIAELTALYEIGRTLASSQHLNETASRILEILATVLHMRRGTLTLLDSETGELVIDTAHGLTAEEIARGRFKIGEGITGLVFEKGEPMIVPDIGREPLFLNRTRARGDLTKERIAFIGMPIKIHGVTIGVLSVDRLFDDGTADFEEDVRVLTVVASLIGQTVKFKASVGPDREKPGASSRDAQIELPDRDRLGTLVGNSRVMNEVFESVLHVCKSKATVLLRGESGTGKELIARAIHSNSPRSDRPFIKVNCAALPETLLESELFGHERGAFTGATHLRKGRFELADGGTLFLDEIGDLSPTLQVKLLRVLQEQRFERLGGSQTLSVDVRLVAATHRDLEAAIEDGRFREDLYYRLNVVPIFLPPLRDRKEDIPLLIEYFLSRSNKDHQKQIRIAQEVLDVMIRYHWPGNVRELENCVERMVIMSEKTEISFGSMPSSIVTYFNDIREVTAAAGSSGDTLPTTVEHLERQRVIEALKQCGGVQSRAAHRLGITPRQIGYKIKKYKIKPS